MKHCNICSRDLINGTHAGLCAGCYANVKDIVIVFLIPLIGFVYVISPIDLFPELFVNWPGYIDDVIVILVGLFFQVMLIIGVFRRKRSMWQAWVDKLSKIQGVNRHAVLEKVLFNYKALLVKIDKAKSDGVGYDYEGFDNRWIDK